MDGKIYYHVSNFLTMVKYALLIVVWFYIAPDYFAFNIPKDLLEQRMLKSDMELSHDFGEVQLEVLKRCGINDVKNTIPTYNDLYPTKAAKELKSRGRDISVVNKLVIHHSASNPYKTIENMADEQIKRTKWPRIGYHFVIETNGTVLLTNDLDRIAYGAYGINTSSIHICLIGNFEDYEASTEQIESLKKLVYKLDTYFEFDFVAPHNHFKGNETQCCGKFLEIQLANNGLIFRNAKTSETPLVAKNVEIELPKN